MPFLIEAFLNWLVMISFFLSLNNHIFVKTKNVK